jgi:orotate phosphoribosyltransferase
MSAEQADAEKDRLCALLKAESLLFGDFTLASGRKSAYYFDSNKTTLLPEGAWLTARLVLRRLREEAVQAQAIGGLTLGADPIVCPVAALSHVEGPPLRAFLVRKEVKEHGTGRKIEGCPPPGTRAVIVDDVVTTAGSTLAAIEAAEGAGLVVAAVLCLVDREEGGTEKLARWPFFPLFRRSEIFGDVPAVGENR